VYDVQSFIEQAFFRLVNPKQVTVQYCVTFGWMIVVIILS